MFVMSSSPSKCFHCTHVFDLTNLKGEKRRNVGKELNIINQLAKFYDLPVSNLRTFVDGAYDIFVCNQCFNSLKSITESQAKSDKILNNFKNSASTDFKSLTSKLQYQTKKTCTETSSTNKRPLALHHLTPSKSGCTPKGQTVTPKVNRRRRIFAQTQTPCKSTPKPRSPAWPCPKVKIYSPFNRAGFCTYKSTISTIDKNCQDFDLPVNNLTKQVASNNKTEMKMETHASSAIGRSDIVQISTEEQSSPIVLSGFPDTLLMPQTKLVQNIDVTTVERPNTVITQDIGDQNHISKGQISKELPPRSSTTSTNGTTSQQGNLVKKNKDTDFIRNMNIVLKASRSVGIIRGPHNKTGTGFRVGDCYIMTALHVVDDIMKILQGQSNGIDYNNVCWRSFFIDFGYWTEMERNGGDRFGFTDLVYKNINLDVAILELRSRKDKSYPPPIVMFEELTKDQTVYLIGHTNSEPMMSNTITDFYNYSEEEVNNSKEWAISTGILDENDYKGIDNQKKTLFHCSFRHGASGALGVMVMPDHDEPVGVLMLLKGYPEFYYSKKLSISKTDKGNFLIIEQGVLLRSIEDDMKLKTPNLKNKIFSHRIN